jgi:hypothetical protein
MRWFALISLAVSGCSQQPVDLLGSSSSQLTTASAVASALVGNWLWEETLFTPDGGGPDQPMLANGTYVLTINSNGMWNYLNASGTWTVLQAMPSDWSGWHLPAGSDMTWMVSWGDAANGTGFTGPLTEDASGTAIIEIWTVYHAAPPNFPSTGRAIGKFKPQPKM